jgi:hypothetical protein
VAECLQHIVGLTQLQELELRSKGGITAQEVTSILTSLKQLTSLALVYNIEQPVFDALLTHAPQLTSFSCNRLSLKQDRSASPCSWKELVMDYQDFDAETLACLPSASLTRLAFGSGAVFPCPCPTLDYSFTDVSEPGKMPRLVHRSLSNLVRCSAWQECGPGVNVRLGVVGAMPELPSLFRALAPLGGKEVKLSIDMPRAVTGASAVQQLSAVLGSSLKQLVLEECQLPPDFWPAMSAHLPGPAAAYSHRRGTVTRGSWCT